MTASLRVVKGKNGDPAALSRAVARPRIVLAEMPPFHVLSREQEGDLVRRVQVGDVGAVEALFRAYYPLLLRIAWSRMRRRDLAEEVVEEIFLYLLEHPDRFTVRTTVEAYLIGAVRNTCLARLRAQYREERRYERIAQDASYDVANHPSSDEDESARLAVEAAVKTALAELPERKQILVTMRWYRGASYGEIAEVVESTPAAVKMQLSRILRGLRGRVDALLHESDRD